MSRIRRNCSASFDSRPCSMTVSSRPIPLEMPHYVLENPEIVKVVPAEAREILRLTDNTEIMNNWKAKYPGDRTIMRSNVMIIEIKKKDKALSKPPIDSEKATDVNPTRE